MTHIIRFFATFSFLLLCVGTFPVTGQIVGSHQKISDTEGGFTGVLQDNDNFGHSQIVNIGDLDGDGVTDIATGSRSDDGGFNRGAVWILFMNNDGTVKSHQKISDTEGGFTGVLDNEDGFGISMTSLGDLDNDGVVDLAVGASADDDGGFNKGAIWILFLHSDGSVKAHHKISAATSDFTGVTSEHGTSVSSLGDVDNDGVTDLLVSDHKSADGGSEKGAAWVLFLNSDGTVKGRQKISDTSGGFTGQLLNNDNFGFSVSGIGDLDGDGTPDAAVGATNDDDGGASSGATWVLFLNSDGTVKGHQKISATEGGLTGLDAGDAFGQAINPIGDLDGDGILDLAVGAYHDDDGGTSRGALWILYMNTDGTVKSHEKISDTEGGFTGDLENNDLFGGSVVLLGDLNEDGASDLAVGSVADGDGGSRRGAIYVLFLDAPDVSTIITPQGDGSPIPAGGGTLEFEVSFTNNTSATMTLDVWMEILRPDGSVIQRSPKTITLAPGDSFLRDVAINIKEGQQAGAYTTSIHAGTYPIADFSAEFDWEKEAGSQNDQNLTDDWEEAENASESTSGSSVSVGIRSESAVPDTYVLEQNYPNPFNPSTVIRFGLPFQSRVKLVVYDLLGRPVQTLLDGELSAGSHEVNFDASPLPSGTYLYTLETPSRVYTQQMQLIK